MGLSRSQAGGIAVPSPTVAGFAGAPTAKLGS